MQRLKFLRQKNKMKQSDLAKLLSISRESISKYENGLQEPNFEVLKKLARVFNVSVDYLIGADSDDYVLIARKDFDAIKQVANQLCDLIINILSMNQADEDAENDSTRKKG